MNKINNIINILKEIISNSCNIDIKILSENTELIKNDTLDLDSIDYYTIITDTFRYFKIADNTLYDEIKNNNSILKSIKSFAFWIQTKISK